MTTEAPKKRTVNREGPLTEFQAAEQICRLIAEAQGEGLAEEVRLAVLKKRAERRKSASEQIAKRMARVPEDKRANVAAHVLRALGNLGGFDLGAGANDAEKAPAGAVIDPGEPDDFPETYSGTGVPAHNLGPDGPVVPTERIEKDEAGARKVGASRK